MIQDTQVQVPFSLVRVPNQQLQTIAHDTLNPGMGVLSRVAYFESQLVGIITCIHFFKLQEVFVFSPGSLVVQPPHILSTKDPSGVECPLQAAVCLDAQAMMQAQARRNEGKTLWSHGYYGCFLGNWGLTKTMGLRRIFGRLWRPNNFKKPPYMGGGQTLVV